MDLNSVLIGSDNPARLAEYYGKLFGKPVWEQSGFVSWQVGSGFVTVGPHDQVKGKNASPGRLLWGMESKEVKVDFDRLVAAGATVVAEPYAPGEDPSMTIATLSDPDDNYFQLLSPFEPGQ